MVTSDKAVTNVTIRRATPERNLFNISNSRFLVWQCTEALLLRAMVHGDTALGNYIVLTKSNCGCQAIFGSR